MMFRNFKMFWTRHQGMEGYRLFQRRSDAVRVLFQIGGFQYTIPNRMEVSDLSMGSRSRLDAEGAFGQYNLRGLRRFEDE
jgi:hypothetical protein